MRRRLLQRDVETQGKGGAFLFFLKCGKLGEVGEDGSGEIRGNRECEFPIAIYYAVRYYKYTLYHHYYTVLLILPVPTRVFFCRGSRLSMFRFSTPSCVSHAPFPVPFLPLATASLPPPPLRL